MVLTRKGEAKQVPVVVPLNIRFDPSVKVTIEPMNGLYRYSYQLANGKPALDPICSISLVVSPSVESQAVQYTGGRTPGWAGGEGIR